jgi:hypothetical protein
VLNLTQLEYPINPQPTPTVNQLVKIQPCILLKTTDDNQILDRTQDNATTSADDPTLYNYQNSESNNPNLIATQTQPEYLAIIVTLVACVAAIASIAIFVGRRQTKNSKQTKKKNTILPLLPFFM